MPASDSLFLNTRNNCSEALRVGIAKLWTNKNFQLIVDTAARLPEAVRSENDELLMYVDLSSGRGKRQTGRRKELAG